MNRRQYRILFRFSLLVSLGVHLIVFIVISLPVDWFGGEVVPDEEPVLLVFPFLSREQAPASIRKEVVNLVDVVDVLERVGPLTLRETRSITIPRTLNPVDLPSRIFLDWYDVFDLSHVRILPPYTYSRFLWQLPERGGPVYSFEDLIRQAFLDSLMARKKKEELLVNTGLGEFGVTPGTLHLGPIKIPIPFRSFSSMESRVAERQYEEIKSHHDDVRMDDDDLANQRERILEWKKRQKGVD